MIEGNRSTVYYQNANGQFIIPLSAIGFSSINVKLISDAYPTNAVTYTLKAEIYAAPSNAARAPMNGEVIASYTLSYEKDSEVSPALKVTGAQKVVGFDQSLTVQVEYQLPTNGSVSVELWARSGKDGSYGNTAIELDAPAESGNPYTISSFEGFRQNDNKNYSYCLMFFVKDQTGKTVLTVPYYFVLYDME